MTLSKSIHLISNIIQVLRHHGQVSHPRVSWLVHVALNLSGVSHEILHPPIFKCSWIRSRKYGLYTAMTCTKTKKIISPSNLFWSNSGEREGRLTAYGQDGCGDPVWCLHAKTSLCLQQKALPWAWSPRLPHHHWASWGMWQSMRPKGWSQHSTHSHTKRKVKLCFFALDLSRHAPKHEYKFFQDHRLWVFKLN